MIPPRVIPVLQINDGYLVKTTGFKHPRYLGDPINAVKIFNDKQVDELIVCDIGASKRGVDPDMAMLEAIASEAFMPVGFGGNVQLPSQAARIIDLGVEKVLLGSVIHRNPEAVREMVSIVGSQSIIASVDVRRDRSSDPRVYIGSGQHSIHIDPETHARNAIALGVGEILITSIDREGQSGGFDLETISRVAAAMQVPVVALGGAATDDHFRDALAAGASAVAAGSRFVFYGRLHAVLITYPSPTSVAALVAREL